MTLEKVQRHVFGNSLLAFLQCPEETWTDFGGDLVAYVEQLPDVRIELLIGLVVPDG